MHVPNQHPTIDSTNRIAIIGEAPGEDESLLGKPFVGISGRFLSAIMSNVGIARDACLIGNICQVRPPGNDIKRFLWEGSEIQDGLSQLSLDLNTFKPNVVLLLGNTALKAAMDPVRPFGKRFAYSVSDWRGSVGKCIDPNSPLFGYKYLSSYHPAAVLRNYAWCPVLKFDLKKTKAEAVRPDVTRLERMIDVDLTPFDVRNRLEDIRCRKPTISIDIEGYVNDMICISVAESPTKGFIVPFTGFYHDVESEMMIWRELSLVLADPLIPKILQNSLYDRFVLQYSYNLFVANVREDTMLKHWEQYCELEKSLAFQASIYTSEPYYKFERKNQDQRTHWNYCCKDSCVTYEISNVLDYILAKEPMSKIHYEQNVNLLNPLLYMELRGIKYDTAQAAARQAQVEREMFSLKDRLDNISDHGLLGKTTDELRAIAVDLFCYKRDGVTPYTGKEKDLVRAKVLLEKLDKEGLVDHELGELSNLLELDLNTGTDHFRDYLYQTLKLPLQTNEEDRATADYEALLALKRKTKGKNELGYKVVDLAIQIRHNQTRSQMLRIHADPDGRIRCGYNLVGTKTGRLSCYTSPTGSGYNLQTIPTYDRDLFIAEEDHWFFQCDLKGADGWTVGAWMAFLGDATMLDDLRFGIKPAAVVCYMLRHGAGALHGKTREEIKELLKEIKKDDWDYFGCKQGIWGTCYLMGPRRLANQLMIQSEGQLIMSESEAKDFQRVVFTRYNVKRWHDFMASQLAKKPVLVAACGHKRHFFGRSREILGEALAHEPQINTTYATNSAMWKLWSDSANRRGYVSIKRSSVMQQMHPIWLDRCYLRIEPLHSVHDALCGQFPKSDTAWATTKIKSYFDNPLVIAHQQITIPFEGAYGPSWGDTSIGTI